jgi:hypothetical protein
MSTTVDELAHGMKFGWYRRVGDGWRIKTVEQGGDYVRVNSIDECQDPTVHLVKFGNDFGKDWIDHNAIAHNNWHFWDNPLVPHFLYPNVANPSGKKDWIRWVPGDILSTQLNVESGHEHRINSLLTKYVGATTEWRDIVHTHTVVDRNSRRIMLTPSSLNCYPYYYDDTREAWIARNTKMYASLGYEVLIWNKGARRLRTKKESARLYSRLAQGDIRATVSQHSASAIESLCAGVPVIATGPHPCGVLATHELNFLADQTVVTPSRLELDAWIVQLLSHVRHKSEIFSGAWHD